MKQKIYEGRYAGHALRFAFQYPATRLLFHGALTAAEQSDEPVICATPERIELARSLMPEVRQNSYLEYRTLIGLTGRALLRYDCSIFHAVSFEWDGKAYLLAAPSGTGKSTQYFNWQRQHPEEITMISGDMPVLERRSDGGAWVHPSNWNGKENIGNPICAPLAGLVFLEQGTKNVMERLSPREAIPLLFRQFMVLPETEDEILALSRLMDAMLRTAPVWKLINRGDAASTELLRDTLAEGDAHGTL